MASLTPEEQLTAALKAQDLQALYDALANSPTILPEQLEFLAAYPSPFDDRALLAIAKYTLPEQPAVTISNAVLDRILQLESYEHVQDRAAEYGHEASAEDLLQALDHTHDAIKDYIDDLTKPSFDALHRSQPSTASEALYRSHPSLPADNARVAAAILTNKWGLSDVLFERAEIQKQPLGDACFEAALAITHITDSSNARILTTLLHHAQFEPNATLIAKALYDAQETLKAADHTQSGNALQCAKDIDFQLRQYLHHRPALRKEIGDTLARPNLPMNEKARAFVEAVDDHDVSVEHAADLLTAILRKGYDEKKNPIDIARMEKRGQLKHGMTSNDSTIRAALDACPPFEDAEKQERLLEILKETEIRMAHDGYRRHTLLAEYFQKHELELSAQRIIPRTSWGEMER